MSTLTDQDQSLRRTPDEERQRHDHWHSWGSPIGLGVGLLCVGGFFVLLALGLSVLDSIG